MILEVKAKTKVADLTIDFIQVITRLGKSISIDWDTSFVTRTGDMFEARYVGVYFNEEYANGKLEDLENMTVDVVEVYSEEDSAMDIEIVEMIFYDEGRELTFKDVYKTEDNMRKNIFKIIAMGALATIMTATTVGCNGGGIGGKPIVDENGGAPNDTRTAMYISMFEGEYGRAWLDRIVNEYNAAHPENSYKISVLASKDEFETLQSRVLSGTLGCDMFITNLWIHKLISAGAVEDISSVWTSDPDNNGSTIESIMYNATDYKAAYGDGKGGLYALPLQESLQGFVYDHDLFLTYLWATTGTDEDGVLTTAERNAYNNYREAVLAAWQETDDFLITLTLTQYDSKENMKKFLGIR